MIKCAGLFRRSNLGAYNGKNAQCKQSSCFNPSSRLDIYFWRLCRRLFLSMRHHLSPLIVACWAFKLGPAGKQWILPGWIVFTAEGRFTTAQDNERSELCLHLKQVTPVPECKHRCGWRVPGSSVYLCEAAQAPFTTHLVGISSSCCWCCRQDPPKLSSFLSAWHRHTFPSFVSYRCPR